MIQNYHRKFKDCRFWKISCKIIYSLVHRSSTSCTLLSIFLGLYLSPTIHWFFLFLFLLQRWWMWVSTCINYFSRLPTLCNPGKNNESVLICTAASTLITLMIFRLELFASVFMKLVLTLTLNNDKKYVSSGFNFIHVGVLECCYSHMIGLNKGELIIIFLFSFYT